MYVHVGTQTLHHRPEGEYVMYVDAALTFVASACPLFDLLAQVYVCVCVCLLCVCVCVCVCVCIWDTYRQICMHVDAALISVASDCLPFDLLAQVCVCICVSVSVSSCVSV
jgi:hypothetical protein